MRRTILMASALMLGAAPALADDATKSAIVGTPTYGAAGCGLGAMAFGSQGGAVQILAATTNGLFGTQTFGITSGTSNCGKSLFAMEGTKVFIEGNREALAKDAARGSGETIVTITHIARCKDSAAVGAALQRNYQALFPSADAPAAQVRDAVIRLLVTDEALGCRLG